MHIGVKRVSVQTQVNLQTSTARSLPPCRCLSSLRLTVSEPRSAWRSPPDFVWPGYRTSPETHLVGSWHVWPSDDQTRLLYHSESRVKSVKNAVLPLSQAVACLPLKGPDCVSMLSLCCISTQVHTTIYSVPSKDTESGQARISVVGPLIHKRSSDYRGWEYSYSKDGGERHDHTPRWCKMGR